MVNRGHGFARGAWWLDKGLPAGKHAGFGARRVLAGQRATAGPSTSLRFAQDDSEDLL